MDEGVKEVELDNIIRQAVVTRGKMMFGLSRLNHLNRWAVAAEAGVRRVSWGCAFDFEQRVCHGDNGAVGSD